MKTPYRIRKRMNPRNMDSPAMYYPTPCYFSMVSTEMLSEEISHARDITDNGSGFGVKLKFNLSKLWKTISKK